ncbi:methyl-accepting chemotaxis protein [Erwinia aphidicola]|uniref:methyl-accepting chemotaxis protein n=1 Tax=Erwinia aphidicola TaxID=68334 RepID=UPI00300CF395
MLKNLKIQSAISLIIGLFALVLLLMTVFSVYNSMDNNKNFKRIVVSSVNDRSLRDAAYNISSSFGHINGLMLQQQLGYPPSPEMVQTTDRILKNARERMDMFMSSHFNSAEEAKAANAVSAVFEALYKTAMLKKNYIANPAAYSGSLEDEVQNRYLLRAKMATYAEYTDSSEQQYLDEAENDNQQTIVLGVSVVIGALLMLLFARIWLKHTLARRLELTIHSLETIAAGDLSNVVEHGARNEIGLLLMALEQMRNSLTATISGIRESVLGIHKNAREISTGNSELSSRTEEQASALQQTAASMEQIKTTVRQNADNAHTARQLAESASGNARNGGEAMHNLEQIMQQITSSSRQIADINGVIDSIANQTNILALNAAVEAARAGEQGRGFAVVAEEVRNLAKRSAEAAKEINQLINTCVATMDTGSRQVVQASAVMQEIVSSVTQVTEIMGEITSASDEQSAGINQISQAVNEMDLVTQQNAAMVEEAAMASGELEMQSDALENLVSQFVLSDAQQPQTVATSRVAPGRTFKPPVTDNDNDNWETF